MKKYTEKDILKFKCDTYGRLICPSGDYTAINSFGDGCGFGKGCSFGDGCSFGNRCSFGEYCIFGKRCSFGYYCSFVKRCIFGEYCSFGDDCSFGEHCNFREHCSFRKRCSFGDCCNLANNLIFEGDLKALEVLKIGRIGSRKGCTYFYKTEADIFVRCGCFLGTIAEFRKQVFATHKENEQYKLEYLEAIKYAKKVLGGQ